MPSAVRFFVRRYPLGAAGAVIMTIFLFAAAFAPYITVYDPLSTNAAASLAPPSTTHWLGCDFMGRDVYSRIIYGARISLMVSTGSMLLGCSIGVTVGLLSGYLLGWFDLVTQRVRASPGQRAGRAPACLEVTRGDRQHLVDGREVHVPQRRLF